MYQSIYGWTLGMGGGGSKNLSYFWDLYHMKVSISMYIYVYLSLRYVWHYYSCLHHFFVIGLKHMHGNLLRFAFTNSWQMRFKFPSLYIRNTKVKPIPDFGLLSRSSQPLIFRLLLTVNGICLF